MMGPIVEKVSKQLNEQNHEVKIYKFNIEQDKQLSRTWCKKYTYYKRILLLWRKHRNKSWYGYE